MKNQIRKFLEFNGRVISFLSIDGQYWVAIKPICDALNVNYNRQFQNLKKDPMLSQLFAEQQMVGADNRARKMVSLPEKYIYGWLFSIKSDSKELMEYKKECYDILYSHFHGLLTNRAALLREKAELKKRASSIAQDLIENDDFKALKEAESDIDRVNRELRTLDTQVVSDQLDMFKPIAK